MSRTITEHELAFALNCLGVDSAMSTADFTLAEKLFDTVQVNHGEHPTLVAGEQCSTSNFATGECSGGQSNPIDDAVRLSHAAASVTEAIAKVHGVSIAATNALTDLVENLSRRAIAGLGQIDVAGPVQITTIGDVQMLTSGAVTISGQATAEQHTQGA